jgi:hypothetical protein
MSGMEISNFLISCKSKYTMQNTQNIQNIQNIQNTNYPGPSLNGGLFTGEPFAKGAPWGNVPVVPEGDYLTNVNLQSADPPPGATYQYVGSVRLGNNHPRMPGVDLKGPVPCISGSFY